MFERLKFLISGINKILIQWQNPESNNACIDGFLRWEKLVAKSISSSLEFHITIFAFENGFGINWIGHKKKCSNHRNDSLWTFHGFEVRV